MFTISSRNSKNPCGERRPGSIANTWTRYWRRISSRFGRSGRIYKREETLGVPAQEIAAVLPLSKFEVRLIDTNVALVTYVSEVCYGDIKELANRSSLWSRCSTGWRIRFHQGTAV